MRTLVLHVHDGKTCCMGDEREKNKDMSVESSLHALKQEHALKRKKGEAMSEVEIAGLHHTYIGKYQK